MTNGWAKTLRIIGTVISFIDKIKHNCAAKAGKTCTRRLCNAGMDIVSQHGFYTAQAELYLYRREALVKCKVSTEKERKAWRFQDGIFYYNSGGQTI